MLELPFTREQFFDVFAAYNAAIWPAPVVATVLGLAVVIVPWVANPPQWLNKFAVGCLALMWAWTGVAYHGLFFVVVNPVALGFGALFVLQAALLAGLATTLRFGGAPRADSAIGSFFVIYSLILYPLIGHWSGHAYPAAPMFGVTPCPVTIFTFGLLLQTEHRPPWALMAIPFIWSLIGGSAAFLLGVVQDWVLLLSGVAVLARHAARR